MAGAEVEGRVVKSFYRVTKSYPPTDIDYQTRFDREGPARMTYLLKSRNPGTHIQRSIH